MSDIVIRPAAPADYARIRDFTLRSYVDEGYVDPESPYKDVLGDVAARAAQAEVLVAELDGTPVGSLMIVDGQSPFRQISADDELEFRMLATAPEARGRGVGTALVRTVIQRARDLGRTAVVLSTDEHMRDARRVYTREGFVAVPERAWSPGPGHTVDVLRLDLTQARTVDTIPAR